MSQLIDSRKNLLASALRACAAGSALWREDLVPESHAQLDRALRAALQTWMPAGEEEPSRDSQPEEQALIALDRAGYRGLERLRAALAVRAPSAPADQAPAPGLSTEAAFDLTSGEAERLIRFTARHYRTQRERRRRRQLLAGGLAVALVVVGVVAGRLWLRPRASASAVFNPEFPVANAIDGKDSTEWLLPDGQDGWLQIIFPWSRRVHSVLLVNAHNRPYLDRAVKEVRVTAFSDFEALASTTGSFNALQPDRSTLELPLEARGVTHVRVDILSHFGKSGGLADVIVR